MVHWMDQDLNTRTLTTSDQCIVWAEGHFECTKLNTAGVPFPKRISPNICDKKSLKKGKKKTMNRDKSKEAKRGV